MLRNENKKRVQERGQPFLFFYAWIPPGAPCIQFCFTPYIIYNTKNRQTGYNSFENHHFDQFLQNDII